MSLDFDLTSKRIRNLKVLQSINSNVFEIVEDVSHVALYKYETGSGSKWERVDVEGPAFVTRNKESPFYSLVVLNKKGPTDFSLDLTPKIRVKVQDIYVMIRCNAEIIIGLWFHDEEERTCLFQHLKRITADGCTGSNGGFAASLLKLQAQAASKEASPIQGKEPTEKLKYADVVTKKLKDESKASPAASSPTTEGTDISPANCSAVKKNMLLSVLRSSSSESELKDKAGVASAASESSVTSDSGSIRPVGLSQSENNLGRLLLEGISSKKNAGSANGVSDVKKVLFTESEGGVGSKNSSTDSMTTTASSSSACSGGIATLSQSSNDAEEGGVSPGSARLLSLLKASGRNGSHHHQGLNSSSSSNSTPVVLSSQDSPVPSPPQSVSPVNGASAAAAAAPLTDAQRSDRLLAMLKHATTSSQAMDLLTDGDIASKQNKVSSGATVSPVPAAAGTSDAISKKSSSDRLLSMLKSGGTPVPTTSAATTAVSSPLDKKLVSDSTASKENQLKNLLSIHSGSSPSKSPAMTPLPAPLSNGTSAAAAAVSTTSPGVVKSASEERTVNLLSSLAVVKRSPELRPLNSNTANISNNGSTVSSVNSGTSASLKSASPSTVNGAPKSKPLLLSPSDLLKLSVA